MIMVGWDTKQQI